MGEDDNYLYLYRFFMESHKKCTKMIKNNYYIFIILIFALNSNAQNFSFFDNFEIGIKPLVYAINDWNVEYSVYDNVAIDVYEPQKNWEKSKVEYFDPVQVKNYFTQEYDIKYFFKAYKNFKIGLGMNYKMRKLEYDIFINPLGKEPKTYYTIWAFRYKVKYDYLGYNINFRWDIPKISTNFNFFYELNRPFNTDRRSPELSILYNFEYYLITQSRHPTVKSTAVNDYIGIDINTRLYRTFYLNIHFAYKTISDYDSRFSLYDVKDQESDPILILKGGVWSNDIIVGLGVTYQFSKKSLQDNY